MENCETAKSGMPYAVGKFLKKNTIQNYENYKKDEKHGIVFRKKLWGIVLIFLSSMPAFSQEIIISGELRPKIEYRNGVKTLLSNDQSAAFLVTQRSRLNISYKDAKIATLFSVQDVRFWGETPYKQDVPSLVVFAAWGEYFFNDKLSLRLGRQSMSYDKNRLIGTRNWNDVGSSHDLALLMYDNGVKFDVGFAYNNDKAKNYEQNYPLKYYKTLGFVRGEKDFGKNVNASLIVVADGYQEAGSDKKVHQRITWGGNVLYKDDSARTSIYGTVHLQDGNTITGQPINAYFFALKFDTKLSKSLTGTAGTDYFSGNDAYGDGKQNNAFNQLYGNGHSYYGYMDYFTEVESHTKGGGLMDMFLRFNYKFNKKTSTELTYHNFSFTNNVIDSISSPGIQQKADKHLGSEIDIVFQNKPAKNIDIKIGYSMMFASKSMEIIKGGDHTRYQHWGWVLLTFKPEFYKHKL